MGKGRAGHLEKAAAIAQAKLNWKHPVNLVHAVTSRCNADCEFCAWKYHSDTHSDLALWEIKKLYREARRAGFFSVILWGGEPLVCRSIGEIAGYAKKTGLAPVLVTNAYLLEKRLDAIGPHVRQYSISLDHPSELHDEIRGLGGLYERILGATKAIKRRYPRSRISYTYTMYKRNIDVESIRKMAALGKSLDVPVIFNPIRIQGASEIPDDVDLKAFEASQEEISEAFRAIRRLKRRGYPILNSYTYMNMMCEGPPRYRCHWPKFNLPIEANGDVVDCINWGRKTLGNIRETPLAEILKSERMLELAGPAGEKCCKCVSLHRIDISESYEGNFEPLLAWARAVI